MWGTVQLIWKNKKAKILHFYNKKIDLILLFILTFKNFIFHFFKLSFKNIYIFKKFKDGK